MEVNMSNTDIIMVMYDLLRKAMDDDISGSLYDEIEEFLIEIEGDMKNRRML
jgi:hypothetical protein